MADYALYPGAWSGEQVDEAVGRALSGGELDQEIAAIRAAVGSPLVANTAAAMTDTTKVYVYTGTEAGYTAGHWYYWNGSAWADGGVYNAVAVDDELSDSSVNAVQNKVITAALADLEATAASKLDVDGTAQQAAALMTDQGYTDTAPYTYRRAGAGHAGTRSRVKSIVGGTLAWNQLVASDAVSVTVPSVHTYVAYISGAWSIVVSDGTAITVSGANGDMVTDLTLMFGSAIADRAYSLESGTPGASR